ncbi:hypothetical protein A9R05_15645 [Burkholderia sp. KK1]|nr:hypothetical protein A9R05_15645 [Burkholderia sp. KK1]
MHIAWVDLPDGNGGGPRRLDGRPVVMRTMCQDPREPIDMHASRHLSFPQQQSTIDQFFDESQWKATGSSASAPVWQRAKSFRPSCGSKDKAREPVGPDFMLCAVVHTRACNWLAYRIYLD